MVFAVCCIADVLSVSVFPENVWISGLIHDLQSRENGEMMPIVPSKH